MKLTILGKYGPFPPVGGATSGYLLQSENSNVLLDLGSGVYSRLIKNIEIEDLSFIIFSHLHFDHVSDFGVLSYALNFSGRKDKINLYLPKFDCDVYQTLSKLNCFNLIDIEEGVTYKEGDLTFSFYKMTHPVLSYGVKITDGEKTFAYSGDTTYNDNLPNLLTGVDLGLVDGAFLQKDYVDGKPHMSVIQAASLSKYAGKIIVSHISYNYCDSDVAVEIEKTTDRAEIAIENKTYTI